MRLLCSSMHRRRWTSFLRDLGFGQCKVVGGLGSEALDYTTRSCLKWHSLLRYFSLSASASRMAVGRCVVEHMWPARAELVTLFVQNKQNAKMRFHTFMQTAVYSQLLQRVQETLSCAIFKKKKTGKSGKLHAARSLPDLCSWVQIPIWSPFSRRCVLDL
jgi:hypothetical protein